MPNRLSPLGALAALVVLSVSACGGNGTKQYTATATVACLRHRPEAHEPSPPFSPLTIMQLNVYPGRRGNGLWVTRSPDAQAWSLTFFPAKRGVPPSGPTNMWFFKNRTKQQAYYNAVYRAASIYLRPDLLVQERGNVVLEWSHQAVPTYLRIALGCLRA